jgi:hypothetical protein
MPIRTAPVTDPVVAREKELVRIVFSDDGIAAVWRIPGPNSVGRREVTVEVTKAVAAQLLARVTWGTAVDAVAADTAARAVLPP